MSVLYDFVCWICIVVAPNGPYWFCCIWALVRVGFVILCVDVCIRIIDLFIVFLCRDVVSMCFLYVFCADVSVHYDFVCWICVGVSP